MLESRIRNNEGKTEYLAKRVIAFSVVKRRTILFILPFQDNLLLYNHARLMSQDNHSKEYLVSIMFSHYDRNNNGNLEREELEQVILLRFSFAAIRKFEFDCLVYIYIYFT